MDKAVKVSDEIRSEHDKVEEILAQLEEKPDKQMYLMVHKELHGHHAAEESVVFPLAMREGGEEIQKLVRELIEEHHVAHYSMGRLKATDVNHETWPAQLKVLTEIVKHHVEEEENEFLPQFEELVGDPARLQELTQEFEEAKEKAMENVN